jgi:hypothetical protein
LVTFLPSQSQSKILLFPHPDSISDINHFSKGHDFENNKAKKDFFRVTKNGHLEEL